MPLVVPNFSFHDPDLADALREAVGEATIHYLQGDPDHGRTVLAISGEDLEAVLLRTARAVLPRLDLRGNSGVHPRTGALDVAPFVGGGDPVGFARAFAAEFGVPVWLYEESRPGRSLPDVRLGRAGPPDFGPPEPHPRWGGTVVGARGFLLALNIETAEDARPLAREVRRRRENGEPGFAGVRALGFPLKSRGRWQLSMNLTRPDAASGDALVAWTEARATVLGTELVGVCRPADLPRLTRFPVDPAQVVPDAAGRGG